MLDISSVLKPGQAPQSETTAVRTKGWRVSPKGADTPGLFREYASDSGCLPETY